MYKASMRNLLFILCLFSLTAIASDDCASSIATLKVLTNDPHLPTHWIQRNASHPFTLTISDSNDELSVDISNNKGNVSKSKGTVCKSGIEFIFRMSEMRWGSASPMIVRPFRVHQIGLDHPYRSVLMLKSKLGKLEFEPNE
jgi:hypothetical protein